MPHHVKGLTLKFLIFWVPFSICCCSILDEKGLKETLRNKTFEWHLARPDTSLIHKTHFFQDSLYILIFRDADSTSYSQAGTWFVEQDHFNTFLRFRSLNEDGKITLRTNRNGQLKFRTYQDDRFKKRHHNYRYYARRLGEPDESETDKQLLGSWYDSTDHILAPYSRYIETGEAVMNPVFTFSRDSFNIQTESYREKGIYRLIKIGADRTVLLLSNRFYRQNLHHMTIDIDHIDSAAMRIRLDKPYKLQKRGG